MGKVVKPAEPKLTVNLSRKALDTLNLLTETSGFGSRGRTIEEAILAVDDLARLGDQFLPVFVQMTQNSRQTQETLFAFLGLLNSFITYYMATIARFKKPVRPSISPQSIPTAATSGGKGPG